MKYETIADIEKLTGSGLTGYIFHLLTLDEDNGINDLTEVAFLDGGSCTVMAGSAPLAERREQFLKLYKGCQRIAQDLKLEAGYPLEVINNPS